MNRVTKGLFIGLWILAATAGFLYAVVGPNPALEDGDADPILAVRRPIVRILNGLGVLKANRRYNNRQLPSGRRATVRKETASGEYEEIFASRWTCEPVFRGLFWCVGYRVSFWVEDPAQEDPRRALRLCYQHDKTCVRVAESACPRRSDGAWVVSGFVPDTASGYWVEWKRSNGETDPIESWGDTDAFVSWG